MKRFSAIIISVLFLFAVSPAPARSECPVDLSEASAAILMDAESGRVVLENNADKAVEVAGLKRLPALLAVCEAFDKGMIAGDTVVTVPAEAAKIRGTTAFLSPNERIRAELLLKASVILTSGDSICSLIKAVYPSESAALEALNSRNKELGIETEMKDCMGNDAEFTVRDIAKISLALSDSEAYKQYSSVYLDSLEHDGAAATELTNPNRLVRFYSGCFGLATGSVGASEYCGAFIAKRGTTTFLAVITGMPNSKSRFELAAELLDHGFSSYRTFGVCDEGTEVGRVPVTGGKQAFVEALTGGAVSALMPTGDTKVKTEVALPESIIAPVKEGDVIGSMILTNGSGERIGEVPLIAKSTVERAVYGDYFRSVIASWLRK